MRSKLETSLYGTYNPKTYIGQISQAEKDFVLDYLKGKRGIVAVQVEELYRELELREGKIENQTLIGRVVHELKESGEIIHGGLRGTSYVATSRKDD